MLDGQVRFQRVHVAVAEGGRPQLDGLRIRMVQVLGGVAQHGAPVRGEVDPRLRFLRLPLGLALLVLIVDLVDLLGDEVLAVSGCVGINHGAVIFNHVALVERLVGICCHGLAPFLK